MIGLCRVRGKEGKGGPKISKKVKGAQEIRLYQFQRIERSSASGDWPNITTARKQGGGETKNRLKLELGQERDLSARTLLLV